MKLPTKGKVWVIWFCLATPFIYPLAFGCLVGGVLCDLVSGVAECFKASWEDFKDQLHLMKIGFKNSVASIKEEWNEKT
jgi:hypothetical protein